ncbi:foldase [Chryseotalea sanaruensis]|uniref:Periplasmic chaperone PpiD n=1 Tax=Chryseotalea sanaruensis TaxID=2482724 RepID=A0A401UCI9_9BACT|nr:peptidylprolyl isomerase [Chryseotalea sanaruensis]GCC52599.1 foldase [Chryseotalea sanaruensis]
MALIGTLRTKMGTWVVVFVFVAVAAFILGDLFGNNGVLTGRNTVGEIAGHEVSLEEYQAAIQEREANYAMNFGRSPGEREMTTIRQQAWELLIVRHAIEKQYGKVGVSVSAAEVQDLLWGKNVDENVRQSFTNPETGQFEKDRVISYLAQLKDMPEGSEPRVRWEMFQRDLAPSRTRMKYENLLVKGDYVTSAEAEREYHNQSDVVEASYLYVPFFAMSDSAVKVSDADLKNYYNKNKEKYKTENTRDIKFVAFPVIASAEDTLAIFQDVIKLAGELKISTEDSAFVNRNSDNSNAYIKYTAANLPSSLSDKNLVVGELIGPQVEDGTLSVSKVSKIEDDTVFSARARHILIKWDSDSDADKKAAKEKARNILKEIKDGADFSAKARDHGTDGTASRGGDLGWFSSGQMVKLFEKAVFDANKTGVLNDVVETEFGYHLIDVTNTKTNKAYYVARIERAITPSDASINEALRKAEAFASEVSDLESFEAAAKAENVVIRDAKKLLAGDRTVSSLGEARQLVQWLFRDADKGEVSTVFDLQENYVVAVMTGEVEKGYKPLDMVKDEITPMVKNELKGNLIIEKLSKATGTLEEVKTAFGSDATVYSSSDVRLSSNSLPNLGFDPIAVGLAFSLENGKRSKPFISETGVVIIETNNKTIAPALGDYAPYKLGLQQAAQNRNYSIAEAIKDRSDIEDKRYNFF